MQQDNISIHIQKLRARHLVSEKIQTEQHKHWKTRQVKAPATDTRNQEYQAKKPENQSYAAERISAEQILEKEKWQREEPYNFLKQDKRAAGAFL